MSSYKTAFKSEAGRAAILNAYNAILAKWPVLYEEIWINTSYGQSYIIHCGDRNLPPLILLHGTSSNSAIWIGDAVEYSKHFSVYAIDIPGEPGKSEEKQYPWKINIYGRWLHEVIEKLHLTRVSLLGISLGGWLALGFAVNYPQKAEKIVLLSPSGIGPQKISFIFKALPLMLWGDKGIDRITHLVNGNQPIPAEALEYTKLIARNFNMRVESIPIYTDKELQTLTMPLLLFAGKEDVLLDSVKTVQRVQSLLPHAETILFNDRGHLLVGLTGKITDFLCKVH